ncbi:beta-ketoacyl synthase N-terminal-like domain-containing protein [Candidatus Parabeggiatoa sp. HSG14]|uniref:L-histidine N(alpha)-methyltransferase n=1 Tax=Candidatus Parabeggiatoa sp. HSG14 TaxID=3055593 RepID=UPI0025A8D0EB|nr:L-histidine N(alpha)-methyltransferase [Thiotrichales bacterium HSG14]
MDDSKTSETDEINGESIAIIGMSGRFPGAQNIDEFWQNLKNGVESIAFFSTQELLASGIDPTLLKKANYVKAKGALINDIAEFDAAFFGFSPKEAEITDPQQRIFLECAWEALENAGYNPQTYPGAIGVYGGVGISSYLLQNLLANHNLRNTTGDYQLLINNDKDFLCTRVSYKLNLSGPSVTVQTACSTSLVAIVMGCQNLLDYQCDMVLAGGTTLSLPNKAGYLYQEGMIMSPDGHCRAFDAKAQGTVGGSGVGIVVLKRLEDALRDGDYIHAVIKGTAINNDGALKIGYTAPSVEAQKQVIAEALDIAEISPETIGYVETHGTGTPLGDPIEIAALTQAFRANTDKKGYCAVGSVKTNIGHLDAAAGVTGLIKTVLSLKHHLIPPSLHFETPNPKLDLDNSPFYVNTELSEWKTDGFPRRAGVSSFGIGGTNAHIILEEMPNQKSEIRNQKSNRSWQLLLLSAKTDSALETATTQLIEHLKQHPDLNFADVAYTHQVGRCAFNHRRLLVCQSLEDAVNTLETRKAKRVFSQFFEDDEAFSVVFMFSGQGAQYVNMGLELYQTESVFREQVDHCAKFLKPLMGLDLRNVLYPTIQIPGPFLETPTGDLKQTAITQPALFVIEYALAQLWMSWGVQPKAMIGHSIGEYVAACLAGVFTLEETLTLVAARGQLMQSASPGAMLAVPLSEDEIRPLLPENIDLSAINIPSQCVVSGTIGAVGQFANKMAQQGLECQRLQTSHAFHSEMMSPILTPFFEQVQTIDLKPPKIPFLSNITGSWITHSEATDPHYWVKHIRQTVRFAAGLQLLLQKTQYILLEVGPGRTLSTFAKRHPSKTAKQSVLTSLRHPQDKQSDNAFLLNTLGQLWMGGITINWSGFYANEQRYRLPLPTYPYERQRYWIDAQAVAVEDTQFQPFTATQLWTSLIEAAHKQAQQGNMEFDSPDYAEKLQLMNRLCTAYVNIAFQELGAFTDSTQAYSLEILSEQLGILPFYRQMFPRCMRVLVEQGDLQQRDDQFIDFVPLQKKSLDILLEEVKTQWADSHEKIALLQVCGEKFAGILTGKENPRELLFTGSAFELLQNLYQSSQDSHYFNSIIQSIFKQIVKSLPAESTLRILEIGAGTGATTAYLLPELPAQRTRYVFTDVGSSFLESAQQKFSDYSYLEYRVLDVDQMPTEQGYKNHSFDIIIAAQVLHATKNLGKTLEYVRSLLAPEGILLLWEPTQSESICFDVAFPLLQPFENEDELRSQHPFLTTEQWHEGLQKYEFAKVESFPQVEASGARIFMALASSVMLPASYSALNKANTCHPRPTISNTYASPRNETEQIIANLWQKFFNIERIGVYDDFFELGGDSLMAVQLIAELRKIFQVELSAHTLLKTSTIAALAESLQTALAKIQVAHKQTLSLPLVSIQTGNSLRQPLFLIPPAGGHVYFYRDLAHSLGEDQPIYGLEQLGLDGKQPLHSSIEEIAAYYVKGIQAFKPTGPYCLGGSSSGGLIVFEMAQQLHALGQKVALLVMIDTAGPNQLLIKEEVFNDDINILKFFIENSGGTFSSEHFNQLDLEKQEQYILERLGTNEQAYFKQIASHGIRQLIHVMKSTWRTINHYTPDIYPGHILFFHATEPLSHIPVNAEHFWIDLAAKGMEIHEIPGNHYSMNSSPNVEALAKVLRTYFDKV